MNRLRPTDEPVRHEVLTRLRGPATDAGPAVEVAAENGIVTLTGQVASAEERARAERLAASCPGVRQVVNQIAIDEPRPTAQEEFGLARAVIEAFHPRQGPA